MSNETNLEGTFDTVAATYEKLRPGYAAELYQRIFQYISIKERDEIYEFHGTEYKHHVYTLHMGKPLYEKYGFVKINGEMELQ